MKRYEQIIKYLTLNWKHEVKILVGALGFVTMVEIYGYTFEGIGIGIGIIMVTIVVGSLLIKEKFVKWKDVEQRSC